MQPLVSICIPTYNRAEYLDQTIKSIICQPEFKSGEVEIVVSDNASTDNTREVCERYNYFHNFFYNRNKENIFDKNYPTILSIAHGKLRKLNNDTFVLKNDALSKLCSLVRKYDNDRPFIFLHNEGMKIKECNFRDFVLDVGYYITCIASFTIWDNDYNFTELDTDGCELKLWQVKKAYELVYRKNAAVVSHVIIGESITPPKKDISYGLFQIFYCNYMKLLQPYKENLSLKKEDIDYLEKELLLSFFPNWIIRYELNNTDIQYSKKENLKDVIWNQYKDKSYWKEFERIYKKKLIKAKIKQFVKVILERK